MSLASLGLALKARGYRFVTPTPETHRRVLARGLPARTLRDVFGWSKPFDRAILPPDVWDPMHLLPEGALWKSTVRFSSLGDQLFAHSAYPTTSGDSVFFGPDTYRFCALLQARIERAEAVVDVGCGSGAGGLCIANRVGSLELLDINPKALEVARANCEVNAVHHARVAASDVLAGARGPFDLVVANPPYLADDLGRAYRDGGGALGTGLSARIVEEALDRLPAGGRLVLYTASPVVEGEHVLWPQLEPLLRRNVRYDYRELDPDVFGEELDRPAYAHVERIAVVALDAVKR